MCMNSRTIYFPPMLTVRGRPAGTLLHFPADQDDTTATEVGEVVRVPELLRRILLRVGSPRAAVLAGPAQHLDVAFADSPPRGLRVPRAAVGSQPLQDLELPALSSPGACELDGKLSVPRALAGSRRALTVFKGSSATNTGPFKRPKPFSQRRTSMCPARAAPARTIPLKGQPLLSSHFRSSRLPPPAASVTILSFIVKSRSWWVINHCTSSRCPTWPRLERCSSRSG